jgi:hypothetical protein
MTRGEIHKEMEEKENKRNQLSSHPKKSLPKPKPLTP